MIGKHDKRVAIERPQDVVSASGSVSQEYELLGLRWAHVRDLTGREQWQADQVSSDVNKIVELREDFDGLTPKDRIKYGVRVYEIVGITGEMERDPRTGQVLQCREVVE